MDEQSAASWIQTGGVLVFAGVVLWELRQLKPTLAAWVSMMGEVREILAATLERERIRGEARRRRDSSDPPNRVFAEDESTNLHDIMAKSKRERARTPRGGVRPPRPGTHHDDE